MSENHEPFTSNNQIPNTWAMLCHISAFAAFIFPLGNIVAPLIIYASKRYDDPLVDDQGKESINFQISMTLYMIASAILIFVIIGIFLLIALGVFWFIIVIVAALKANEGVKFRYPLTIKFLS